MNALRLITSMMVLAVASLAFPQAPGLADADILKVPAARDDSAPGEGAITGGAIPRSSESPPETGAGSNADAERAIKRCYELSGTLRDQCLLQEKGASAGGTSATDSNPAGPTVRDPRTDPPPQNPR